MIRNFKAFGLALVAMLAISVIGAQTASAVVNHEFTSANNDTVLTGQSESYGTGNSRHVFQATPGLTVECDATFEGTNTGTEADTVTVRPTYTSCAGGVTVHNTGCEFVFDSDTTTSSHSSTGEHAAVDLDCEDIHYIEITITGCRMAFHETHTGGVTVNQDIHGVRYTQLASHSGKTAMTVNATASTIRYTATAGSFCGLAGHGAGTYSNGSYTGTASVTGYEPSTPNGNQTNGRTWSHGAQVNIGISTP